MKRRNRLTAVLTAGVMSVLCAVPVPAQADEKVVIDGITYYTDYYTIDGVRYDSAGVEKCDRSLTNAVIQSTVNGIPVTYIGSSAFSGCTSLTTVTIPDNVETIRAHAFSGCTSLTAVTIPDHVTFILDDAFEGCTSLTAITIPEGCAIYRNAFFGCTALQTVTSSGDHPYYFKDHAIYRDNCLYNYVGGADITEYTVPADTAYLGAGSFQDPPLFDLIILNPDCYIPDGYESTVIDPYITIHGYDDSTAYRYAMVNGNKFVSLGKSMTTPSTPTSSTGYAPADLDGNGVINAADAASILLYAAYVGAGGTDDIMTFLAGR